MRSLCYRLHKFMTAAEFLRGVLWGSRGARFSRCPTGGACLQHRGRTMTGCRKWIDLGNDARMREPTKAAAAFHRQQQAETRAMKRRIEADTCGLGRWEEPEGWSRPTFSHTVTLVSSRTDHWLPYISG